MKKTSVLLMMQLLLLMDVVIFATSAEDSVLVVSYRKLRKTKNGPEMCALDLPNKTMSSSSLQDCSLTCARDVACDSFSIKGSEICDVFNYKVKVIAPVSACTSYQVTLKSELYNLLRFSLHHRGCTDILSRFYAQVNNDLISQFLSIPICSGRHDVGQGNVNILQHWQSGRRSGASTISQRWNRVSSTDPRPDPTRD